MLVFEHIPKTAGTTFIISYLEAAFLPQERFLVSGEPGEHERDVEQLIRMPKSERRKLRMVAGHYLEMFRLVEPEARYISLVRDPVRRVISAYRHFLSNPSLDPWAREQFGDHVSLRDYALHVLPSNQQAKTLLGGNYEDPTDAELKERLQERFHLVGLTEDFIGFVMYLHFTENMPLCLFNDRNTRRDHTVEPTEADLEAIRQRNSLDIRLYEIIRDDFSSRYRCLVTPEMQALAERYRERLNVYRERTRFYQPDHPPSAVVLKQTPESWAAKDDYQAIFQELPPSWPERALIVPVSNWINEEYLKSGSTLQKDEDIWRLETSEQLFHSALRIPLVLPLPFLQKRAAIKIDMQVGMGRIGIYVMDAESKAMLTPEVQVLPSRGMVEIRLDLPAQFRAGILYIRNLYSSASQAMIRSIDVIDNGPPSTATEFVTIQTTEREEQQQEASHLAVPIWKLKPINNGVVWVQHGAIALETPSQQWAYGALLRFPLPGIEKAEQVVKVRLKVKTGIMGLGWVNEDNTAWITRTSARPTPEFQDVSLVIPAGTKGGALIFDNWTEGGLPARAVIQGIWIASGQGLPGLAL